MFENVQKHFHEIFREIDVTKIFREIHLGGALSKRDVVNP